MSDTDAKPKSPSNVRISWSPRRRKRPFVLRVFSYLREFGPRAVIKRVQTRLRTTRFYRSWIKVNDVLSASDIGQITRRIDQLPCRPLISVILQIEGASAESLRRTLRTIVKQLYPYWELLVAIDGAVEPIKSIIAEYAASEARIKIVRRTGGGRVQHLNTLVERATGELLVFLDDDDFLATHALYLMAEEINSHADATMIYGDEDRINPGGRRSYPHFKTDWNPDLFLSDDYIGHAAGYRRAGVVAAGGVRAGFDGAEFYDLALRMTERALPQSIRHIPFILNHLQCSDAKTAAPDPSIALASARRALQAHLDRAGICGSVEASGSGRHHRVCRLLPSAPPSVSIIIPTRDQYAVLQATIESLTTNTDYPDYEIVVVDNQSSDPIAISYLADIAKRHRIRVLHYDHPFNYSAINNFAVRHCRSEILAFANNDILVINHDWLREMVSHAIRPEVGAVGAMLFYPDNVIQHAGVIVGIDGAAVNCYSGLPRGTSGYFSRAELIQNYSAVTAACLLTRADVYAEVGGMNEIDLPVAFNDVDYCLRLREKGYLVTWTPYAELCHLESVSRGDDMEPAKVERFRREQHYFAQRWPDVVYNDPYYNPNLSLDERPFALAMVPRVKRPWRESEAD